MKIGVSPLYACDVFADRLVFMPGGAPKAHGVSYETANGNQYAIVKKLQGICQAADWVFATAQGPKSMFR